MKNNSKHYKKMKRLIAYTDELQEIAMILRDIPDEQAIPIFKHLMRMNEMAWGDES